MVSKVSSPTPMILPNILNVRHPGPSCSLYVPLIATKDERFAAHGVTKHLEYIVYTVVQS